MAHDKLRQQIACEAARLMFGQQDSFHRAKFKAARLLTGGWVHPRRLPSHREIRAEIEHLARLHEFHDDRLLVDETPVDRFAAYSALLAPLETIMQPARSHPEGDALYHSLQVFQLACDELPYDEEFLLAALLHDVGKALDARDSLRAGLDALQDLLTPRSLELIERQPEAQALLAGTLGVRARKRLEESEHFEEVMLLVRCDRAGRAVGVSVPDLQEALDYVRDLARLCDE
jgi:hypothetical protein